MTPVLCVTSYVHVNYICIMCHNYMLTHAMFVYFLVISFKNSRVSEIEVDSKSSTEALKAIQQNGMYENWPMILT